MVAMGHLVMLGIALNHNVLDVCCNRSILLAPLLEKNPLNQSFIRQNQRFTHIDRPSSPFSSTASTTTIPKSNLNSCSMCRISWLITVFGISLFQCHCTDLLVVNLPNNFCRRPFNGVFVELIIDVASGSINDLSVLPIDDVRTVKVVTPTMQILLSRKQCHVLTLLLTLFAVLGQLTVRNQFHHRYQQSE